MQENFTKEEKFYKGRKIIRIAFENDAFPLPKQYPSGINDWKKDEMDSSHILFGGSDKSLPSVKCRKKNTEKERVLESIV